MTRVDKEAEEATITYWWEQKPKEGRPVKFTSPDHLWSCAIEYFEWVELNPLQEQKLFHFQGAIIKESVDKMRAMTAAGLCVFLGIGTSTWHDYKDKPEFSEVTRKIDDIMRTQKFSGAAADLLNANIIARDLGLADKQDNTHAGPNGGAIENKWSVEFVNATPESK